MKKKLMVTNFGVPGPINSALVDTVVEILPSISEELVQIALGKIGSGLVPESMKTEMAARALAMACGMIMATDKLSLATDATDMKIGASLLRRYLGLIAHKISDDASPERDGHITALQVAILFGGQVHCGNIIDGKTEAGV